jgi:hypothetical protein
MRRVCQECKSSNCKICDSLICSNCFTIVLVCLKCAGLNDMELEKVRIKSGVKQYHPKKICLNKTLPINIYEHPMI